MIDLAAIGAVVGLVWAWAIAGVIIEAMGVDDVD